jgi:hypothetical protein
MNWRSLGGDLTGMSFTESRLAAIGWVFWAPARGRQWSPEVCK